MLELEPVVGKVLETLGKVRADFNESLSGGKQVSLADVIVLGGGLSNVQALYQPVNEMLARYVFSGECDTQVKAPQLGAESGVLGAAQLWSDNGG